MIKAGEIIKFLQQPENTNFYKRADLKGWYIASNAGLEHKAYGAIDQFSLYLEEMYQQGGRCDVCEKEWKKIEIEIWKDETKTVLVHHYEPDCTCYPRCIYCNRWMIEERKRKQGGCSHCGRDGIRCWKKKYIPVKDEKGEINEEKKGTYRKCNGILTLQAVEGRYTIMRCNSCDNIIKKEIIVSSNIYKKEGKNENTK